MLSSVECFTRSTSQVIVERPPFYILSPNPLVHIKLDTLQHMLTVADFLQKMFIGKSQLYPEAKDKRILKEIN